MSNVAKRTQLNSRNWLIYVQFHIFVEERAEIGYCWVLLRWSDIRLDNSKQATTKWLNEAGKRQQQNASDDDLHFYRWKLLTFYPRDLSAAISFLTSIVCEKEILFRNPKGNLPRYQYLCSSHFPTLWIEEMIVSSHTYYMLRGKVNRFRWTIIYYQLQAVEVHNVMKKHRHDWSGENEFGIFTYVHFT